MRQLVQSYRVKAPNLFATVNGIYEFTGWGGTNVSFANSGNQETEVVFEAAGATATASYTLVSNQEYGVVIPAGDELIIPAGANFACANFFTLYVEGELIIASTPDEPVSLVTNFDTFSPELTAFIEVSNGGKLYGSGLQITGESGCCLSPPLIKAQPGSIVKIDHSTFTTNGTGIMVTDAYVELSRCVISPVGTPTNSTSGIDITLNEHIHNSYAEYNFIKNQVILENSTIRGMDKGIDINITINGPGSWQGLYTHNSILTENNTGLFAEGYLSSNVYLNYVNMSNSTNYDISQSITTNHIQTADSQLDVNHYPAASSPVIDAGDPSATPDPDGTRIDLGAYYFHQNPSAPTNFRIKGFIGSNARLMWSHPEPDVNTFNILRKLGNGNFVMIATVNTTSYTDNTVTVTYDNKFSQDACYMVEAVDDMGYKSNPTSPSCIAVNGPMNKEVTTPVVFALHTAFPNPFNPTTTIRFDLPVRSRVTMIIHDLLGREIKTLIRNSMEAGFHEIQWNGQDHTGKPVSAGIYICRFTGVSEESEKRMDKSIKLVLMK